MVKGIAARLGIALALVLVAPSCGKKGSTSAPGGGGGAGKGDAKGDGVALRYAAQPLALQQTGSFDSTTRARGTYNEIAAKYTVGLQLVPNGDKVKVTWTFADVGELDLKGSVAPKPGGEDPRTTLMRVGKGAYLVDLRGEVDEDASKSLPENAARKQEIETIRKQAEAAREKGQSFESSTLTILETARAMATLPQLPEQSLPIGKPVVVNQEEELQFTEGGPKMPTETETTYTLVKVDDSGARRIAELQFESVTSGAMEQPGIGMLALDSTTEGTMLFDLDTHVPVSMELESNQELSGGSEQLFQTTVIVKTTFEAG